MATRKAHNIMSKKNNGSRKNHKQGGGGSDWLTAVKKEYAKLKKSRRGKKLGVVNLGDAMQEAKKKYKKKNN